jgi:hypothetical protein
VAWNWGFITFSTLIFIITTCGKMQKEGSASSRVIDKSMLRLFSCRSVGPKSVVRDRNACLNAVPDSWKNQLLLNIVPDFKFVDTFDITIKIP